MKHLKPLNKSAGEKNQKSDERFPNDKEQNNGIIVKWDFQLYLLSVNISAEMCLNMADIKIFIIIKAKVLKRFMHYSK